jgi:hypothetical protein
VVAGLAPPKAGVGVAPKPAKVSRCCCRKIWRSSHDYVDREERKREGRFAN